MPTKTLTLAMTIMLNCMTIAAPVKLEKATPLSIQELDLTGIRTWRIKLPPGKPCYLLVETYENGKRTSFTQLQANNPKIVVVIDSDDRYDFRLIGDTSASRTNAPKIPAHIKSIYTSTETENPEEETKSGIILSRTTYYKIDANTKKDLPFATTILRVATDASPL